MGKNKSRIRLRDINTMMMVNGNSRRAGCRERRENKFRFIVILTRSKLYLKFVYRYYKNNTAGPTWVPYKNNSEDPDKIKTLKYSPRWLFELFFSLSNCHRPFCLWTLFIWVCFRYDEYFRIGLNYGIRDNLVVFLVVYLT